MKKIKPKETHGIFLFERRSLWVIFLKTIFEYMEEA